MQKKRSLKIISVVLILMLILICISITYVKTGNKEVLATTNKTKEFNTENLKDNEHMHVETDSNGDKVPVPNGYVGSKATGENEIDTGYVIYEGTEAVNDSNVEEAQKTRNQYVWVPVPDASTMYGTDENGKRWGKLYSFTTNTGEDIDPVTGAKPLNWTDENGKIELIKKTKNREPEITLKNIDIDSRLKTENTKTDRSHIFLLELENEFNNMMDSIEENGGFYIGRYETGNIAEEKVVIVKGNTDLSKQNWYTLYNKCKNLKNNNMNVETGMIWGSQWDRTLMWLIESGNRTKEEICRDSTSWGNYNGTSFEYINSSGNLVIKEESKLSRIPTGNAEYTKSNNIYDLAGNVSEWTIEIDQTDYRNSRAGNYGSPGINSGADTTASSRYNDRPNLFDEYRRMSCNALYKIKF